MALVITFGFGFAFAFDRPSDMVRLAQISADERFIIPLTRYEIEVDFISCDVDPLYIRFVSNDSSYGLDYSRWPETFSLWAAHYMACRICPRIKNDIDMKDLESRTHKMLVDARSKAAMQEPTRFPPMGSWASARLRGRIGDRPRGANLIG